MDAGTICTILGLAAIAVMALGLLLVGNPDKDGRNWTQECDGLK